MMKTKKMVVKVRIEKYDFYCCAKHPKNPIVTVGYILSESFNVGRGVSVRDHQDEYNEEKGKVIARGRAIAALEGRQLKDFRREDVINRLIRAKCPFVNKCDLNPRLSWWERKLLFGPKNMRQDLLAKQMGYFAGSVGKLWMTLPNCRCTGGLVGDRRVCEVGPVSAAHFNSLVRKLRDDIYADDSFGGT